MPLSTAQNLALSLSTTLMSPIVLFTTDDGFGVLPSDEFDGAPESVVHVYDPFQP